MSHRTWGHFRGPGRAPREPGPERPIWQREGYASSAAWFRALDERMYCRVWGASTVAEAQRLEKQYEQRRRYRANAKARRDAELAELLKPPSRSTTPRLRQVRGLPLITSNIFTSQEPRYPSKPLHVEGLTFTV